MIYLDRIRLDSKNGIKLNRVIRIILFFCISFLPLPFFINLKSGVFFIRNVIIDGYLNSGMGGIPFPVFGFMLVITMSLLVLYNFKKMINLLRSYDAFIFLALVAFLVLSMVSQYSLVGILQLLMFPILMWLGSFYFIEFKLSRFYFYGVVCLVFLHLMSILCLNNWSISKPFLRYIVYESIFYYQIYQGLISYVNVLTVSGVLLLYLVYRQKGLLESVLISSIVILVLYLAALSSQRSFALDLIVISGLVLLVVFTRNSIPLRNKYIGLIAILIVWLLSVFLVNNDSGDTSIGRLVKTFDRMRDVTSLSNMVLGGEPTVFANGLERVSHLFDTTESIKNTIKGNDLAGIYKGTGNVHSGSHNFILDILSGAGIVGAVFYFIFMLGAAWRFVAPAIKSKKLLPIAFIVSLGLMIFFGSMVNSPITQPYYFLNFIFIAWIIVSDSIKEDRSSST